MILQRTNGVEVRLVGYVCQECGSHARTVEWDATASMGVDDFGKHGAVFPRFRATNPVDLVDQVVAQGHDHASRLVTAVCGQSHAWQTVVRAERIEEATCVSK